jgi:hypothetical protein
MHTKLGYGTIVISNSVRLCYFRLSKQLWIAYLRQQQKKNLQLDQFSTKNLTTIQDTFFPPVKFQMKNVTALVLTFLVKMSLSHNHTHTFNLNTYFLLTYPRTQKKTSK